MRSLVMGDVETNSEWSHILGRAMAGPLRGKTLDPILTDMVTWGTCCAEHPESSVLDMSRTTKNYTRDFYRDPTAFVFGFDSGGKAWALPMEKMLNHPVHSFSVGDQSLLATFDARGAVTHLFHRRLDGQTLDFLSSRRRNHDRHSDRQPVENQLRRSNQRTDEGQVARAARGHHVVSKGLAKLLSRFPGRRLIGSRARQSSGREVWRHLLRPSLSHRPQH